MRKVLPNVGEDSASTGVMSNQASWAQYIVISSLMALMFGLVILKDMEEIQYQPKDEEENKEVGPGSCRK